MKILLILTSIAVVFVSTVTAQKPKVDIAKKIAAATPAALPQAPKGSRPRSDAQYANLRGKVKSIAEYTIELENGKTEKTLTTEEFYDEDGNLVRAVDYNDQGYPRGVGVYGYIDGMRVNRWGPVVYFDGEGVYATSTELQTIINNPPTTNKKDRRYDLRFTYKYDEKGRIIEESHFSNAGELLTLTKYEYKGDESRLAKHFADGPGEIARTMEIYDKEGNVTEEWFYDEDQKLSEIRPNTYEFDPQGNWIVKKSFLKETVQGKSQLKPTMISYRKITYYP